MSGELWSVAIGSLATLLGGGGVAIYINHRNAKIAKSEKYRDALERLYREVFELERSLDMFQQQAIFKFKGALHKSPFTPVPILAAEKDAQQAQIRMLVTFYFPSLQEALEAFEKKTQEINIQIVEGMTVDDLPIIETHPVDGTQVRV